MTATYHFPLGNPAFEAFKAKFLKRYGRDYQGRLTAMDFEVIERRFVKEALLARIDMEK